MTYVVPIYLAYILAFYLTRLFYHVSSGISFCTNCFQPSTWPMLYYCIPFGILSGIHSGILSGIYILTIHLDFVLMCVVTLSNINVLTRYLPCILSSIYSDWHFIIYPMCCWYFILHTHAYIYIYTWHLLYGILFGNQSGILLVFVLAFFVPFYLTIYLALVLFDIVFDILFGSFWHIYIYILCHLI